MNKKAAELHDDMEPYFNEMKEAWLDYTSILAENYFDEFVIDVDNRPTWDGFIDWIKDNVKEEFEFQDSEDWFNNEVSSACDDYADWKYEEMRDERI